MSGTYDRASPTELTEGIYRTLGHCSVEVMHQSSMSSLRSSGRGVPDLRKGAAVHKLITLPQTCSQFCLRGFLGLLLESIGSSPSHQKYADGLGKGPDAILDEWLEGCGGGLGLVPINLRMRIH